MARRLCVTVLLITIAATTLHAQLVVIDPGNLVQTILIAIRTEQQYQQLVSQLLTLRRMAQGLAGLAQYRIPAVEIRGLDPSRWEFGRPWIQGMTSGDPGGELYLASALPLEPATAVLAQVPPAARTAFERRYATVEITDSVATLGGHQTAILRNYGSLIQQAVQSLERDVLTNLAGYHDVTAILDKIAAGELLGRRQGMAANQFCGHPGRPSALLDVEPRSHPSPSGPCRKEHPMNGSGVSAVSAYTAHREWATRPADERFDSVAALHAAACARRNRLEERTIETPTFRTEAVDADALVLHDASGRDAALTHWSFEQLATIAGAPPKYLRTLPATIASSAINFGLQRQRRDEHLLLADHADPWTVHAVTSPRYARVHHDELATRVLDLQALHPAWHLPLGYKDGEFGAERLPSGAYLGDRDMFLFLVDGNRALDDPTDRTDAGLFRGFILRNSDVGAAALSLDVFLFRVVCGNHVRHVIGA